MAQAKYNMILYQKTEDPLVILTDSKTKDVQTKKLVGTYYKIIPPANDRVNFVLTCSEMHLDRFASAIDSTVIISDKLRKQLVALYSC
jgi:chemotaxis regulatin CheY-phosphate phosphatase CheZ